MTEMELQAIKEQLANVPEGWSVSEGARLIEGLKVSGNYLVAEVEFLHVQRDSQAKIIEDVRVKNKSLQDEVEWLRSEGARLRNQQQQIMSDYTNDLEVLQEQQVLNKRLRAALEKIAYTASIKELYEAEAFADRILRGEST